MYLGDMDEELQRLSDAVDRADSVLADLEDQVAEAKAEHKAATLAYVRYRTASPYATHEDLLNDDDEDACLD